MFAEMVGNGLAAFHHAFQKGFAGRPAGAVQLGFAHFARGTADGNVFQRAAETAHGMTFEMGVDNHRIVIFDMLADRHFLQTMTAFYRQVDIAVGVHNVYRTKSPAVGFKRFQMSFGGLPRAGV